MHTVQTKQWHGRIAVAAFAAIFGLVTPDIGAAKANKVEQDPALNNAIIATLEKCQQISSSCATETKGVTGILVFPNVTKADLIVGGSGGKGALIENGVITGYYSIGAVSAGLQVGIESASQVYVFRTPESLANLKKGPDWKVGATAGVTLIAADANARGATGSVLAYVFSSTGLQAGVSLDTFDIWKTADAQPS